MSAKSVLHMKLPQITEIGTGEIWDQTGKKQGKHREIEKKNLSGDPGSGTINS